VADEEVVVVVDDSYRLAGVQYYALDAVGSVGHLVPALHFVDEPLPLLWHFHALLPDSADELADCQLDCWGSCLRVVFWDERYPLVFDWFDWFDSNAHLFLVVKYCFH